MKNQYPNYNAWLHWTVTPKCNFRCEYCIFRIKEKMAPKKSLQTRVIRVKTYMDFLLSFRNIKSMLKGEYSVARFLKYEWYLRKTKHESLKIDIDRMMQVLENTGKIFKISFTGGEPFLVPNINQTCKRITEKHYVAFNTNLTSPRIVEFAETVNPKKVLFIIASLHIKELERSCLLDNYIRNYKLLKKKGFNVFAIEVGHPTLLKEANAYRKFFNKHGIKIQFDPYIGDYKGKHYPGAYTKTELSKFNIRKDKVKTYINMDKSGILCNAGYNAAMVNPDGTVVTCYQVREYLGNIYKKIEFKDKMLKCGIKHCQCPLYEYDKHLYKTALKETQKM
jgi:MoaA/NifB/PqqE/SkfB family radical SAM enzyme